MAVSDGNRVTFWFGCNMLRHAEMIRLSIMLLERTGYDVSAAGGPGYCCGTSHDHQPHGASNMAGRTVSRFNEAATKDGRGTVVTWCPSCHMHMSDIMAPGSGCARYHAHFRIARRVDRSADAIADCSGAASRAAAPASSVSRPTCRSTISVASVLSKITRLRADRGPAHPGHMCSGIAIVPGALKAVMGETSSAATANRADTVCTIFIRAIATAALDGHDDIRVRVNWVQFPLPKPWVLKPATLMLAGAMAARLISCSNRTRRAVALSGAGLDLNCARRHCCQRPPQARVEDGALLNRAGVTPGL